MSKKVHKIPFPLPPIHKSTKPALNLEFLIKNKRSIFIFLMIGSLALLLYFPFFTLLWKILGINYHISLSVSYITFALLYFFLQRYFAFQSKEKAILLQFIKFVGMAVINYLITLFIVHMTVEAFNMLPYVGMVLAIITTTSLSYLIMFFWIFGRVNADTPIKSNT